MPYPQYSSWLAQTLRNLRTEDVRRHPCLHGQPMPYTERGVPLQNSPAVARSKIDTWRRVSTIATGVELRERRAGVVRVLVCPTLNFVFRYQGYWRAHA